MRLLAFVLILLSAPFTPALASDAVAENAGDQLDPIKWDQAPSYIQQQARNVVMHCSSGEYTPDQVRFLRFSAPSAGLTHYVLDFSAMHGLTQQLPGCNYNSPVCGPMGCFLMAYSQLADGSWDQSWFASALSWKLSTVTLNGKTFPGIEVTEAAPACTVVNGGHEGCEIAFTWIGAKFKFIGFTSVMDNAPAQQPLPEKTNSGPEPTRERECLPEIEPGIVNSSAPLGH